MSFIESKGYIHANLRASSVLLFTDDVVKIGGFSASRHADDIQACKINDDEQLAWKWLAPEVMREHMLRPLSDVWSFGIFVIELLQYGAEPYPDVSQREDLQAKLKNSYRHPKPDNCPAALYDDILVNCWQPRTERPSFDLLKVAIKDSLFKPLRRKHAEYINQGDSKGKLLGQSERTMIDNERYLSMAVRTTLGHSINNQYIDCTGMQSVWRTDFGDWEVQPDSLILQDIIGCGNFGIVWKGQLTTGKEIAVKTCATDAMNPDAFMKEVRFMTALDHAHIVKLYGVCTRQDYDMFIVTELMANGDLRHLLINDAGDTIHLPDLLRFAEQISDALEYIEKLNAVHRDIAARNVLVAADGTTAKLGDFGMSRFLTSDYYRQVNDVQIPLLWTAPEVVERRKYTIKSDVWSFGILLVELFLYGGRPYDELEPRDVYSAVQGGYRHPKPDKCPDRVYELMLSCWDRDPLARPSFAQLHSMLSQRDVDNDKRISTRL